MRFECLHSDQTTPCSNCELTSTMCSTAFSQAWSKFVSLLWASHTRRTYAWQCSKRAACKHHRNFRVTRNIVARKIGRVRCEQRRHAIICMRTFHKSNRLLPPQMVVLSLISGGGGTKVDGITVPPQLDYYKFIYSGQNDINVQAAPKDCSISHSQQRTIPLHASFAPLPEAAHAPALSCANPSPPPRATSLLVRFSAAVSRAKATAPQDEVVARCRACSSRSKAAAACVVSATPAGKSSTAPPP